MNTATIFVLLTATFSSSLAQNCPTNDKVIVCYYSSWAIYRSTSGTFNVSSIDPNLCTHLVYTFAGLDLDSKIKSLDPFKDVNEGYYRNFTNLKSLNPCLKTLLAIGGWNEGSKKYSVMSYTQASREAFADSVLRFLVEYDFDGIDVDWEYPTERGGINEDRANFVELMKTLHQKLTVWNLMLSMAVPISKDTISKAYDIANLAPYVDFVLLMAYDFTNAAGETTGLSSPMSPIREAVDWLLNANLPPNKLVLGLATYARSYTLEKSSDNGIGASVVGPGEKGEFTGEAGFLSYYELQAKLLSGRYKQYSIDSTYYAYYQRDWLTYDSLGAYIIKVQYALEKNLGGIMVWTIDTDDFIPMFGNVRFPIINTIRDTLYVK